MNTKNDSAAPTTSNREFHLVCSSGGSRAILASAGVLLACDQAGIRQFKSIGGVSGGSVPTALYASGLSADQCVRQALEIDFASLLTRRASLFKILMAYFMQRRNEKVRPIDGVLTSEKLGEFMESFSSEWPKSYWTMGIADKSEIIFNEAGVFEIEPDGVLRVLKNEPGPLGVAVRGSCAVPGVISAVPYDGRHLFDGALGTEGRCPISVPTRLYGAKRQNIIVCDVGDDVNQTSERIARIWKFVCGPECVPEIAEPDFFSNGRVILIRPKITGFRSLQFKLTSDLKWSAVMAGYVAAIPELAAGNAIGGEALGVARDITNAYKKIFDESKAKPQGYLTTETEKLLSAHGLL